MRARSRRPSLRDPPLPGARGAKQPQPRVPGGRLDHAQRPLHAELPGGLRAQPPELLLLPGGIWYVVCIHVCIHIYIWDNGIVCNKICVL